MRNKKPSFEQFGIDIDPTVISMWHTNIKPICNLINCDAIAALNNIEIDNDTVIYADPPYLPSTRKRKQVYKHDYTTENHIELLEKLSTLSCNIIISGYYSDLYNFKLKGWNTLKFNAQSHCGIREEFLWFNFDSPQKLHDYRYLGKNFREREKIKRKHDRLVRAIQSLPIVEANALLSRLNGEMTNIVGA